MQSARTPIKDLADAARRHYDRISVEACDWLSTIPHAIDAWELQERASWRSHLVILGVAVDVFIRIGDGRQ